jgi:hypothetical protein
MNSSLPDRNLLNELIAEDEFDPLEDTQPDNEDDGLSEAVDLIGAPELMRQAVAPVEAVDERSAKERIADLLVSMAPRRRVLFGILAFCAEAQSVATVGIEVDRLQENDYSVYSAANYCASLEKAGAIKRVTADGGNYSDAKIEPRLVEVDGVEYYEPGIPPEAFWVDTAEGLAALEADKPLERLTELFATDSRYLPIYKRVLKLCSQEGGISAKDLGAAVDSDPLVQKPRLYAPRFVDRLEKCDAIVWAKFWTTTGIGLEGLKLLAEVDDDYAASEFDAQAELDTALDTATI